MGKRKKQRQVTDRHPSSVLMVWCLVLTFGRVVVLERCSERCLGSESRAVVSRARAVARGRAIIATRVVSRNVALAGSEAKTSSSTSTTGRATTSARARARSRSLVGRRSSSRHSRTINAGATRVIVEHSLDVDRELLDRVEGAAAVAEDVLVLRALRLVLLVWLDEHGVVGGQVGDVVTLCSKGKEKNTVRVLLGWNGCWGSWLGLRMCLLTSSRKLDSSCSVASV